MHGVGQWTLPHNGETRTDPAQNIDKQLWQESFTGRFEGNHFVGYGVYRVRYTSEALMPKPSNKLKQPGFDPQVSDHIYKR